MSISKRFSRQQVLSDIYCGFNSKFTKEYKFEMSSTTNPYMYLVNIGDTFQIHHDFLYIISEDSKELIDVEIDGPWWDILIQVRDDVVKIKSQHDHERRLNHISKAMEAVNKLKQSMNVTEIQLDQNTYISSPGPINEIKYETIWTKFKTWLKGFWN